MSHIVEAKTSIQHPDLALLRQVAGIVAQQHGGTVQSFYKDFSGREHSIGMAVHTSKMHRGIGLKIDQATGALSFVGDPWGVRDLFEQVQQEVIQGYITLATMQALAAMGYTAQASEGEQAGQVVVQGVLYA